MCIALVVYLYGGDESHETPYKCLEEHSNWQVATHAACAGSQRNVAFVDAATVQYGTVLLRCQVLNSEVPYGMVRYGTT